MLPHLLPMTCHCTINYPPLFYPLISYYFLGTHVNLSGVLDGHSESGFASLVWSFQADLNHASSQGHSYLFMSNRPPEHRTMPLSFRLDLSNRLSSLLIRR